MKTKAKKTVSKRKKVVGMTEEEWEALKKIRIAEFAKTCGTVMLRRPGTMKDYFSFTRPKNGKVYQFAPN